MDGRAWHSMARHGEARRGTATDAAGDAAGLLRGRDVHLRVAVAAGDEDGACRPFGAVWAHILVLHGLLHDRFFHLLRPLTARCADITLALCFWPFPMMFTLALANDVSAPPLPSEVPQASPCHPSSPESHPLCIPYPNPVSQFPYPISRIPYPVSHIPYPISRIPYPIIARVASSLHPLRLGYGIRDMGSSCIHSDALALTLRRSARVMQAWRPRT